MRTLALDTNNTTSNKRLIVLFVLLLLSSFGMFGQEVKSEVPASPVSAQVASLGSDNNSEVELVSWLMASKQVEISTASKVSGTISTNNTSKKTYINNGMTVNRILSRAFMKKAASYGSTIA